jgi:hypothetical protein
VIAALAQGERRFTTENEMKKDHSSFNFSVISVFSVVKSLALWHKEE